MFAEPLAGVEGKGGDGARRFLDQRAADDRTGLERYQVGGCDGAFEIEGSWDGL
jgi:hypothetical protein